MNPFKALLIAAIVLCFVSSLLVDAGARKKRKTASREGPYAELETHVLTEALQKRKQDTHGSRTILIARLEESDRVLKGPFSSLFDRVAGFVLGTHSGDKLEKRETDLSSVDSSIALWRSPIVTLILFALYAFSESCTFLYRQHAKVAVGMVVMFVYLVVKSFLPQYETLFRTFESELHWYGRWLGLGIMSSIGLGSGIPTFVLFLGPMIAKTAVTASRCQSLSFPLYGDKAFVCAEKNATNLNEPSVSFLPTYLKIAAPAFVWGVGTAIGELPPYFMARSSLGKMKSESSSSLPSASSEEPVDETRQHGCRAHLHRLWSALGKMIERSVIRFGFFAILICASIPNPLFDLAGVTCGLCGIPLRTFFWATFIGKACIKTTGQSMLIVFLLLKETQKEILSLCRSTFPTLVSDAVQNLMTSYETMFLKKETTDTMSPQAEGGNGMNKLSMVMNGVLLVFVLLMIQSLARSYAADYYTRRASYLAA